MYKKIISAILLLGIVGSALADTDWNNGGGDRDCIADGPIIDSGTTAVSAELVCGDWGHFGIIDITGGTLTTNDWFILGYNTSDDGTFNVSGGAATVGTNLGVGFIGTGHMNMTNGTVTVTGTFGIATNGGSGHVELGGGTISCASFSMATGATMSIGNTGTLVVNGDATVTINNYITSGWLTGYGGTGTLSVDYNVTTSGKTTVTAQSGEKASYPSPTNGEDDASVHSDLSWTAGAYAVSHDVYFGTDATPDATEFKDNQPETTFDPGVLNLNTTYYWRIDEVDPCDPCSPWTGNVWSFKTQATSSCGKIIYPFNATTAIVKAGETFEVWFDADPGQVVNSVELHGPYNTVFPSMDPPDTTPWVYDAVSGNMCNTLITVTVPANAPADRYDLLLNTSYGQAISQSAVKVIKEYKSDYTIVHFSDHHLLGGAGTNDWLREKRNSAIVNMANIIGPEMVFVAGDNCDYTTGDFQSRVDHLFDGEDSEGLKGLHDLHAACFVAAGNHDFKEGTEAFNCCYESKAQFWNQYYGIHDHHFKYGNTRCMMVNTGWVDFDFGYQLAGHNSWLGAVGPGNLRLASYHISSMGTMGSWANDIDLGLAMIGHNHHLGDSNPYLLDNRFIQYYALSVREYCEFELFSVDDDTGSYTALGYINTDPCSDGYGQPTGSCRVLENNDQKTNPDTSVWIYNLTLDYANANDGTSSTNTATLVNKFDFAIPGARVRFVMPKGAVYAVSQGVVEQQFDGDSVRVVDVRVDINADSTTLVEIDPSGAPEGASARGDNPANGETADKAFDGDVNTKWLDFSPGYSWIQWRYADDRTAYVTEYAITSANDFPERDPNDWNLLGSNDRFQRRNFPVSSPGAYNIYRLEITDIADPCAANSVQLAEFGLCAGLADFNCSGIVSVGDLSYMADVWLADDSEADIAEPADGIVNFPDFSVLSRDWLNDSLTDGIVAYWKLDGDSTDSSSNGFDGTLYGNPVWDPNGRVDGALKFDGDGDYVNIDGWEGIAGTNSRTVCAWAKTEATGDIVSWGEEAAGKRWLFCINSIGGLRVDVYGGYIKTTDFDLRDGVWHHVAAVLPTGHTNVTDVEFYVDGIKVTNTLSSSRTINTGSVAKVRIGVLNETNYRWFNGLIDDVRIYNRPLSQDDIEIMAGL